MSRFFFLAVVGVFVLLIGVSVNISGHGNVQGITPEANSKTTADRHKMSPYIHQPNTLQCNSHSLDGSFLFTHGELKHYLCALEMKRPQIADVIQAYFEAKTNIKEY